MAAIDLNVPTTGGPAIITQHPQGYRVKSTDQADIVLVLSDGIAAARLSPYLGWALPARARTCGMDEMAADAR